MTCGLDCHVAVPLYLCAKYYSGYPLLCLLYLNVYLSRFTTIQKAVPTTRSGSKTTFSYFWGILLIDYLSSKPHLNTQIRDCGIPEGTRTRSFYMYFFAPHRLNLVYYNYDSREGFQERPKHYEISGTGAGSRSPVLEKDSF